VIGRHKIAYVLSCTHFYETLYLHNTQMYPNLIYEFSHYINIVQVYIIKRIPKFDKCQFHLQCGY
jgi:hypothetical protein